MQKEHGMKKEVNHNLRPQKQDVNLPSKTRTTTHSHRVTWSRFFTIKNLIKLVDYVHFISKHLVQPAITEIVPNHVKQIPGVEK